MCSRFEGIPRSMMEAMAMGLPAVAYEIPGTAMLIQDGINGRLVPLDDAEALARAWEELLLDGAARERMGAMAGASIRERFSAARMARQYEDLYEELSG
jgi:glycosyltransferase involved in cell wall biosynthesis